MTPGLGHNNGPTMEGGAAFRRFAWKKARADLLPTLPIEIVRRRVSRAKELGLPYKTYASVRASTGCDVVGFLFSSNALRVMRQQDRLPQDRADQLSQLKDALCVGLAHRPLNPEDLARIAALDAAEAAPDLTAPWSEIRRRVQTPIRSARLPLDGVLVIGDTALEREWSEAAKLAGFLTAERYFSGHGADAQSH